MQPLHHDLGAAAWGSVRLLADLRNRPGSTRGPHRPARTVCAGIPTQAWIARATGEGRRDVYVELERSLKRGIPSSRLVDLACPVLFPRRPVIYQAFETLKAAGVGNFRFMVDDGLAVRQEARTSIR